ncbi:hypothetical protein XENOCAPTIV_023061 [Xenoophorus captivus]|uniref:Uncharacterized protein n=1 Tax=Xenoophorus captivus TaxID=1517983 RepID=A0ABV0Q6R0_9TELE
MCFVPVKLTCFKNSTTAWVDFSGGQHHTLCLDAEGQVYSLGRAEYGRLGLGQGAEEKSEPAPVTGMEPAKGVSCGASVSYAVTRAGEEEDEWSPVKMTGKQLENREVLLASSGGQHTRRVEAWLLLAELFVLNVAKMFLKFLVDHVK